MHDRMSQNHNILIGCHCIMTSHGENCARSVGDIFQQWPLWQSHIFLKSKPWATIHAQHTTGIVPDCPGSSANRKDRKLERITGVDRDGLLHVLLWRDSVAGLKGAWWTTALRQRLCWRMTENKYVTSFLSLSTLSDIGPSRRWLHSKCLRVQLPSKGRQFHDRVLGD